MHIKKRLEQKSENKRMILYVMYTVKNIVAKNVVKENKEWL